MQDMFKQLMAQSIKTNNNLDILVKDNNESKQLSIKTQSSLEKALHDNTEIKMNNAEILENQDKQNNALFTMLKNQETIAKTIDNLSVVFAMYDLFKPKQTK